MIGIFKFILKLTFYSLCIYGLLQIRIGNFTIYEQTSKYVSKYGMKLKNTLTQDVLNPATKSVKKFIKNKLVSSDNDEEAVATERKISIKKKDGIKFDDDEKKIRSLMTH